MKNKIITIFAFAFLVLSLSNVLAIDSSLSVGDYDIDYSYSGAEEGETFTLEVTITNVDNENKSDVYFEINDESPFDVTGDEDWDIGNLGAGEFVTNTFRVEVDEDISEDEYSLEFTLEDSDDDYDDAFDIDVSSDKADLIVGDVSSSPLTITPDLDEVKLDITLENLGGGDATFTRAKLILPQGFEASSSYSDTANLGTIEAKENKVATFYIDTLSDLDSGNSVGKLELEYRSDTKSMKSVLSFDLPVKGKPQFEILSVSTSPEKIVAGDSGRIDITIQNFGEEEGMQTSVRVFENSDLPISFDEKTNFIGNLDTGESGVASFNFEVDSDAVAKTYLIKVQTRTVNNDNVLVEEHSVNLTIAQAEGNGSLILIVGILILLVILVVLIWLVRRKR